MELDKVLDVVTKFLNIFVFKNEERGRYIESEWDYLQKMIKSPKVNMQRINAYFHVVQEKNNLNQKLSLVRNDSGKEYLPSKKYSIPSNYETLRRKTDISLGRVSKDSINDIKHEKKSSENNIPLSNSVQIQKPKENEDTKLAKDSFKEEKGFKFPAETRKAQTQRTPEKKSSKIANPSKYIEKITRSIKSPIKQFGIPNSSSVVSHNTMKTQIKPDQDELRSRKATNEMFEAIFKS